VRRGIRIAGVVAVATLAAVWVGAQGPANDFVPDSTFSGSTLAGWHTLGAAQWKAQNGELVGTASGGGGWLGRCRRRCRCRLRLAGAAGGQCEGEGGAPRKVVSEANSHR